MVTANFNIVKADAGHSQLLADLAVKTFIESHGHSAPQKDIEAYMSDKYNARVLEEELNDPENIYHLILSDGKPAGFSKIIFNVAHPEIPLANATKLERIYVLEEFYGMKLGWELFLFNKNLSVANGQSGMWLYVWKGNERAVSFYLKIGFREAGSYDFPVSATHSNPNFRMYLAYR